MLLWFDEGGASIDEMMLDLLFWLGAAGGRGNSFRGH